MATLIGTPSGLFSTSVIDAFRQHASESSSITIVTSYFDKNGWKLISPFIKSAVNRKCQVILYSDSHIVNTDYRVLYHLTRSLNRHGKNFYGKVFDDGEVNMLHSKLMLFEKSKGKNVLLIGSPNITGPALQFNLETAVMLELESNEDLYREIHKFLEHIEANSREPEKQDLQKYLKKLRWIEEQRKKELLRSKKRAYLFKTSNKQVITEVKRFRHKIHRDFHDITLLSAIQEVLSKKNLSKLDKVGLAVKRFTKLVLDNKTVFSDPMAFRLMLQIYANILNYSLKKPKLMQLLYNNLTSYVSVKKKVLNHIFQDSVPGRYDGLGRAVRGPFKIKLTDIRETLTLLERFYRENIYENLLDSIVTFYRRTRTMRPRGIGLITGILSALQPKLFIVCNRRTRSLRKISGQYKQILASESLKKYPKFNEIFKYLAERSGIDNLRKMDLIASDIYEQLKQTI